MVVKSELKLIKSLQQKKYRNKYKLFVVEGKKAVEELVSSNYKVYGIYTTDSVVLHVENQLKQKVSSKELQQMSSLKTPNGVLGVFHMPILNEIRFEDWIVFLDGIQDPGNLGTIIRLCDWFGVRDLVCTLDTVDCFNPKVLQATMGSIARVNINYMLREEFLAMNKLPIYATLMDGANIHTTELPKKAVLVMGNEGKGISLEMDNASSFKIAIPQFGHQSTESLNVATATSIFLNEIRRN